jgi:trehalose 2-sulfotransferase
VNVSYLVCATPRSGSTLLCEGLKATGVAGRPEEYFEAVPETGVPRTPEDYLAGLDDPAAHALLGAALPDPPWYSSRVDGASWEEHLARVREWGTTPNGVFGAKLMWGHLPEPPFAVTHFVWVRRHDALRQAISLWRAMQTQSWRSEDDRGEKHAAEYSAAALRHLVSMLTEHDAAWERYLAGVDVPVLELSYDEIAADLPDTLERTLSHLGVPRPPDWPPELPPMRRQANAVSDAWYEAFAGEASRT